MSLVRELLKLVPITLIALSRSMSERSLGRDEAGKDSALGMTARKLSHDRQDPVHSWRRPRTLDRKDPLHIHAQMDAPLGQWQRQQLIAHD